MEYAFGIDVSSHQKYLNSHFDWNKARDAGVKFAFIRALYDTYPDTEFEYNWLKAKDSGIYRGAYNFIVQGRNQEKSARQMEFILGGDLGELPLVCDFEKHGLPYIGFAALFQYMEAVSDIFNVYKQILYTGHYFKELRDYKNQVWLLKHDLWWADWTGVKQPPFPEPFKKWTFWQFASDGVDGYSYGCPKKGAPLDLNRFNGMNEDLNNYTKGIPPAPQPPSSLEQRVDKIEDFLKIKLGYEA